MPARLQDVRMCACAQRCHHTFCSIRQLAEPRNVLDGTTLHIRSLSPLAVSTVAPVPGPHPLRFAHMFLFCSIPL